MTPDFASSDKQAARSELRQQFLSAIQILKGQKCTIYMHENTVVEGKFVGCDLAVQEILVEDFMTPAGLIKHAKLRAGDIISMEFKEDNISL